MNSVDTVPLTEICRPRQWPTISRQQMSTAGFPVYGANGKIGFTEIYNHEKPTIIIGCRGSCGEVHFTEPYSYVTGNAMCLDELDDRRIDQNYLLHFLRKRGFADVISGSSQPQITGQSLERVKIPVPTIQEQRRIAAILDKADAIRRKRRQALAETDTLLRSVFLDMFGDPGVNPRNYKVLDVGKLIEIGMIIDIQDGNHGELHPKTADFSSSGVPFITANTISTGEINLHDAHFLEAKWLKKLRVGFSRSGDVLLSHKGSVGFVAIVPDSIDTLILSPQVTYYRLNEKHIDKSYFANYLKSPFIRQIIDALAKQSTRSYIGLYRQKSLPVMMPPATLQQKFARICYGISRSRRSLIKSIQAAEAFFASLSQRAFRGEL